MRKINQKGYKYYVLHVDEKGMSHIETGWEYREDAKDFAGEREALPGHSYKILTKRFLKSIGIDPENNDSWTKFTLYKPNTKTTMPTLGKTTPAGRAKKRITKYKAQANRQIRKNNAKVLKNLNKKVSKAIDLATKQAKASAKRKPAKAKATKRKTSKARARTTRRTKK